LWEQHLAEEARKRNQNSAATEAAALEVAVEQQRLEWALELECDIAGERQFGTAEIHESLEKQTVMYSRAQHDLALELALALVKRERLAHREPRLAGEGLEGRLGLDDGRGY